MKRVLALLALCAFVALPAFADIGFYLEIQEEFVAGTDGVLPAVGWEFGWESPWATPVEITAYIGDPNIFSDEDDPTFFAEFDVSATQSLSMVVDGEFTLDAEHFHQAQLQLVDCVFGIGIVWVPMPYFEIGGGLDILWLGGPNWLPTPYTYLRFDI